MFTKNTVPARHSVIGIHYNILSYISQGRYGNLTCQFWHVCPPLPGSHTPVRCTSMKTPNQLSREAIEEFKAIYQEEFGEVLSDDEVQEIAMRLLRFFGILNKGK